MKRLVISISGLLAVTYLIALLAAPRRAQVQGWVAAAQQSEHTQAAAISKGQATKAGYKTPGELLTQNKKLSDKLSSILKQHPPVTDLRVASQGFTDLGELFTAAHASQNLGIPFDQVKAAVQTSRSLNKAIHVLKPEADAYAATRVAVLQALEDLDKTPDVQLAQNKKLSDTLSALLRQQNPVLTDPQTASKGFMNLGELFTAAHVSQNLGIPFDQLKTEERMSGSLGKAIHALKPNADAKAELWEAALQATDDIEESYWAVAQSSSTSM